MSGSQTLALGPSADRVRAAVERLQRERFIERFWSKDAAIWTADAKEQDAIRNRLGWLTIAETMAPQAAELERFAAEARRDGFTHAALLGMGGSSLFPEVCRLTFGPGKDGLDVGILDSTDPAAVRAFERRAEPKRTLAIIASKSGTTAEVNALFKLFEDVFKRAGLDPGAQCIAITDAGTPLDALARERKFRRSFILGPRTGADIAGRFSAHSYFGLVPAALMGLHLPTLQERGRAMLLRCGPGALAADNDGLQLGAALAELAMAGRDKLTLLFAPAVASFGAWVEQLVAESTGKRGQGIAPVDGEPPQATEAYAADRVFVELQVSEAPDAALERRARGLAQAGHPVIRILWNDRYDLGGEVVKWSLATSVAGGLLGVNPFDEPNVWESKHLTIDLLVRYAKDRRLPDEPPLVADGALSVYGDVGGPCASPAQALEALFAQRRAADYLALLSFLPRTAAVDGVLQSFRSRLARLGKHATLLEIGPRYLHSTGQLYKGGPDNGVFLLLTSDESEDLPIPGEPYTFGVLKRAQALGDYQAMRQKRRRILRVHIGGGLTAGLQQLAGALDSVGP